MRKPSVLGRKPGAGLLVAALVIILLGGAVPVAQVVAPRFSDRETQTATVQEVGKESARRASRRGKTVSFVLPDGTEGEVYLHRRWNYPEAGDTIEVYWDEDRWVTPEEYAWGRAVAGLIAVGFGLLLVVAWFALRRQADRLAAEPELSPDEHHRRLREKWYGTGSSRPTGAEGAPGDEG